MVRAKTFNLSTWRAVVVFVILANLAFILQCLLSWFARRQPRPRSNGRVCRRTVMVTVAKTDGGGNKRRTVLVTVMKTDGYGNRRETAYSQLSTNASFAMSHFMAGHELYILHPNP